LPGVFSYENNVSVSDILNYKINHDELEESINNLLKKAGEGVIDDSYASLVENFNSQKNSVVIADFIEDLLKRGIP
jgi:hypothetical protein